MRTLLLACAAVLAASAVPAQAEGQSDHGPRVHRGDGLGSEQGRHDRRDRRDRRRGDTTVVLDSFGYYDDSYNGRAFAADSYNDWWHDNPQRSYPRWMQNNRDCQRQWWSGGGWVC